MPSGAAVKVQRPFVGLHASMVHAMKSLHTVSVPRQTPAVQVSPDEHALPSEQVAPSPAAVDPRTEPALRAVIAAVRAGPLDPGLFTENVAAQMPQQEPPLRALLDGKGELVTIVHRGQRNGADIYQALFENGDTQWVIGVDEAGKVAVFLFRETPTPAPGA